MEITRIKEAWHNAFYRTTVLYIATLVTIIFILQVSQFFDTLHASKTSCEAKPSVALLIPVVGVFFGA